MPTVESTPLPQRTQTLLDALKAAGWTLHQGRFPGNYRADSPSMATERPTPDYIQHHIEFHSGRIVGRGAYPFPTYQPLRQVCFNLSGTGRIEYIEVREGVPWVGARSRQVSLPKALAYIGEEVD